MSEVLKSWPVVFSRLRSANRVNEGLNVHVIAVSSSPSWIVGKSVVGARSLLFPFGAGGTGLVKNRYCRTPAIWIADACGGSWGPIPCAVTGPRDCAGSIAGLGLAALRDNTAPLPGVSGRPGLSPLHAANGAVSSSGSHRPGCSSPRSLPGTLVPCGESTRTLPLSAGRVGHSAGNAGPTEVLQPRSSALVASTPPRGGPERRWSGYPECEEHGRGEEGARRGSAAPAPAHELLGA